jgi:hypothetical protein
MIIEQKTEYYHVQLIIANESEDCGQPWLTVNLQSFDFRQKVMDAVVITLQRSEIEQLMELCGQALKHCNNS